MPLFAGRAKASVKATAKMLAKAGADITVCARNGEALTALCDTLHTLGTGRHQALMIDLEETASLPSAFDSAVESFGPVHILINNAGGPPGGPLLANDVADFEAPFRRHLHAAHTLVQHASPSMEQEGFGRIVQIISTSVKEPIPNIGLSNTLRGAMASWANPCLTNWHRASPSTTCFPVSPTPNASGIFSASIQERTGKSAKAVA